MRQSEEQFRLFVTASSDTLYKMSPDWRQMLNLEGMSFLADTTDPSATWIDEYITAEDRPQVLAAIAEAIAAKAIFELEHRVVQADGSVGWTFSRAVPVLNAQGGLVEWFGTATDITARKTAEDAQRRSEERLHLALGAAELGTWDWDLNANKVRWNERHFTMLGLEPRPGLLTPDDFARTIHPDDRPEVLQRLQAAVADNHLFEAEFRILTPQDDVRWMSGHGQASDVAPTGRVRRMTGVLLYVTERKHAEQHLQALAAALERKVARRTRELRDSRDLLQSVFDTNLIAMAVMKAVRDEAGQVQDFRLILVNKELERETGRSDLVGQHYVREYPGACPAKLVSSPSWCRC